MSDNIKLPPLPSPFGIVDPGEASECGIYDLKDLHDYAKAYATAAIEADRKTTKNQLNAYRGLVNSLEARLVHLQAQHDELKKSTNPDLLASERAANAMLTEELEAARKRRGEPVAWTVKGVSRPRTWTWWVGVHENAESTAKINAHALGDVSLAVPLYTAPQPQQQAGAASALKFAAQVVELYDDATMRDDYMIDSGECAGILNALADYFTRFSPQPQQIPEGYKLVPIDPTEEMMRAGCQVPLNKAARHNIVYKAMLEAAPEPKEPK